MLWIQITDANVLYRDKYQEYKHILAPEFYLNSKIYFL